MTLEQVVELAARVLAERSDLDEDGVVALLKEQGISEDLAERCVEFLPIAFGRVLLEDTGYPFSACYQRNCSRGGTVSSFFVDEPVFQAAVGAAQERKRLGGVRDPQLLALASESVEVKLAAAVEPGQAITASTIHFTRMAAPGRASWAAQFLKGLFRRHGK